MKIDKHILYKIVSFRSVSQNSASEAVNASGVTLKQHSQSITVTVFNKLEKDFIANFRQVLLRKGDTGRFAAQPRRQAQVRKSS